MKLIDIISEEGIVPELMSETKEQVMVELVDHLVDIDRVAADKRDDVLLALLKREAVASTGVGHGVAFPHAKVPYVQEFVGSLGVSQEGLEFNALDGQRVHVVFLFLSPERAISGHLDLMAHISGIFRYPKYTEKLRQAKTHKELIRLVTNAEEVIFQLEEE